MIDVPRTRALQRLALALLAGILLSQAASAADYPAPKQGVGSGNTTNAAADDRHT